MFCASERATWMSRLTTAGRMISTQLEPLIGETILNKAARPLKLVGCGSDLTIEGERSQAFRPMSPLTSKQAGVRMYRICVCRATVQTRNLGQHNLAIEGV